VALEVDGPSHFSRSRPAVRLGGTALRDRHLRLQVWEGCCVCAVCAVRCVGCDAAHRVSKRASMALSPSNEHPPSHILLNTNTQKGYGVASVPYWEWEALRGDAARAAYLRSAPRGLFCRAGLPP
jgi:hypothetical protein